MVGVLLEYMGVTFTETWLGMVATKGEFSRRWYNATDWITMMSGFYRAPEIMAWTNWQENRSPDNVDGREFLNGIHKAGAPNREDIATWFDVLDMDDFVSFGGKA